MRLLIEMWKIKKTDLEESIRYTRIHDGPVLDKCLIVIHMCRSNDEDKVNCETKYFIKWKNSLEGLQISAAMKNSIQTGSGIVLEEFLKTKTVQGVTMHCKEFVYTISRYMEDKNTHTHTQTCCSQDITREIYKSEQF